MPRWSKLTGERYGRSPAMTVLPDIKIVNAMTRTVIVGAQKQIDPPLLAPSDGFLNPIRIAVAEMQMEKKYASFELRDPEWHSLIR